MILSLPRNLGWLCLFVLVFGAGCTPPEDTPALKASAPEVNIELDIFSGRPNPQWSLSAADQTYLLEKLQNLTEVPSKSFDQPLGYRGIVVYVSDKKPVTYRIWKNFVTKDIDGKVTTYLDDDRSLETWLLTSGKPYLQADLFETVQQEIGTK